MKNIIFILVLLLAVSFARHSRRSRNYNPSRARPGRYYGDRRNNTVQVPAVQVPAVEVIEVIEVIEVVEVPVGKTPVVVVETPVVKTPVVVVETPVVKTPVVKTPVVVETPVVKTPVVEVPVVKAPVVVVETPVVKTPVVVETPVVKTPVVEVPVVKTPVVVVETPVVKTPVAESKESTFVRNCLAAHNDERASLGIGAVSWSQDLAESAQDWADYLASKQMLKHSSGRVHIGENTARRTYKSNVDSTPLLLGQWLDEKRYFKKGNYPNISTTGDTSDVGHYTAMIWRKTSEIGCGVARGGPRDYLVCQYAESGNRSGKPVY